MTRCVSFLSLRVEPFGPRRFDILAVRAGNDVAGNSHVINLADSRAVPAVFSKVPTKIHLRAAFVAAVHERGPRWSADNSLAICSLKDDAFGGKAIDIWRVANLVAIATQHAGFQIVRNNEQDVLDRWR